MSDQSDQLLLLAELESLQERVAAGDWPTVEEGLDLAIRWRDALGDSMPADVQRGFDEFIARLLDVAIDHALGRPHP